MAWGMNGTPVTVAGSATNIMTISDQTSTKCNMFLTHMIGVSGVSGIPSIRAGNGSVDTGANYANRMSQDGGADGTWASETYIFGTYAGSSPYDNDKFQIVYGVNIGAEEKLFILFGIDFNAAGAGSAPSRQELVAKWANTSVQYDNIDNNVGTNGFNIGSNLSALGSELTPASATTIETGSIYIDTDTNARWWYDGTEWSDGYRGLFGGGNSGSFLNVIDYIAISTTGNATDFGDLTVGRGWTGGCNSDTRGLWGGGYTGSTNVNTIDYVTIATIGNATDFGDITVIRSDFCGCNSDTRGLWGGGYGGGTTNVIDYVTIATTGNATDFGDLSVARYTLTAVNSITRGVFAGGYSTNTSSYQNVIDYITIATTGNATDFGDLTSAKADMCGCNSDAGRGLFMGGTGASNEIQYITIATTGNATDFGDLTVGRDDPAGVNSKTRGVCAGGYSSTYSNVIDYVTIDTTGNATDFGDLTVARHLVAGVNNGL